MNTFQTQPTNDHQKIKQLFQEVFMIQYQLDQQLDLETINPSELKRISTNLDQVLRLLMEMDHPS